jgi:hypothetical protein
MVGQIVLHSLDHLILIEIEGQYGYLHTIPRTVLSSTVKPQTRNKTSQHITHPLTIVLKCAENKRHS